MASSGAFPLPPGSRDAALVSALPAGAYTAPVTGADASPGIALVEVYNASANSGAYFVNAAMRAASKRIPSRSIGLAPLSLKADTHNGTILSGAPLV